MQTHILVVIAAALAVETLGTLRSPETLTRRADAFVAAMNAAGDAALNEFARQHLVSRSETPGNFADAMRHQRAQLGRLDRHMVQVLPGGRVVFVFARSEKTGVWRNFQFRVLADQGDRLQLAFISDAVEPMVRPTTSVEDPATRAWLDRLVASMESQQPFSGVALIEKGGRELYSVVRGVADAESGSPMLRTSRLGMASGSKLFTAVAILQLVEAGKLTLDTPLAAVLPDFPNREFAAGVTIGELLTHTGAAGNYWDRDYERAWSAITETREMWPHVLRHLGEGQRGEYHYSNSGYVLLGSVVEAVTGRSFTEYLDAAVFKPAAMASTGYPLRSQPPPGLARPYKPQFEAGAVRPGSYVPVVLGERGTAAGGASSTVDDLVRFARALQAGKLVRPETLARMVEPRVPVLPVPTLFQGLGPAVERHGGVLSYGHGGMAPGTFFELKIYPDLDIVTVVMSNYDTIAGYELAKAIDDIVRASAHHTSGA